MYVNGVRDNTDMINDCNGCQGCQASLENGAKCGETQTLKILREFHKLYEDKLKKIDENDEGALQLKTLMLQDWVRDLTEQNTMLVQAVEELEQEASGRVALLEEKLKQSSKANYDVMTKFHEFERLSDKNGTFCIIENYQSDINNLLEFIRRIREEGLWSTEGLNFYDLNIIDEFVSNRPCNVSDLPVVKRVVNEVVSKYKSELEMLHKEQEMQTRDIQMKDMIIQDQVDQMKNFSQNSNFCNNHDNPDFLEEMHNLRKELKYRNEEYEKLEKSMKDMREALTAEVADKHDNIVALRRECHMLEEQCRQADKQTHFKDDIIKDMRKELKHLRSKISWTSKTYRSLSSEREESQLNCNDKLKKFSDISTVSAERDESGTSWIDKKKTAHSQTLITFNNCLEKQKHKSYNVITTGVIPRRVVLDGQLPVVEIPNGSAFKHLYGI